MRLHSGSTFKRLLFAAILAVTGAVCVLPFVSLRATAPTDLSISEYIEGSSNNKAIAIYNGTGSAIDLTAGGYTLQMFFKGSTTAGLTIGLSGTVANGDVFVVALPSPHFQ